MAKKQRSYTSKIVGKITEKVARDNNIFEYANKDIVQSSKLDIHTNKHADQFFTIDSYHSTLLNTDKIINNPYYVEYDEKKKSLKYYGKVYQCQYVCVVVKFNKKEAFISTIYPHSKKKIDKMKKAKKRKI